MNVPDLEYFLYIVRKVVYSRGGRQEDEKKEGNCTFIARMSLRDSG